MLNINRISNVPAGSETWFLHINGILGGTDNNPETEILISQDIAMKIITKYSFNVTSEKTHTPNENLLNYYPL